MTAVDIANLSLAMMGVKPIMAFTDDTLTAQVLNQLYVPDVKYCLSLFDWNFALKKISLSRLQETDNVYSYVYQEPVDVLRISKIRDANDEVVEYVERGGKIYTNTSPVYLYYVYYELGMESFMPYYFVEALKFKLASDLAIPIKGSPELYKAYVALFQQAFKEAQQMDAVRNKTRFVDNTVWLRGML